MPRSDRPRSRRSHRAQRGGRWTVIAEVVVSEPLEGGEDVARLEDRWR